MNIKAWTIFIILLLSFFIANDDWNSKGDPPEKFIFNGVEYHISNSSIKASPRLVYSGSDIKNYRIFIDQTEFTPHLVFLEMDNCIFKKYFNYGYKPTFTFELEGCMPDSYHRRYSIQGSIVDIGKGTFTIKIDIPFLCCAELDSFMEFEENIIELYITNKGDLCSCHCDYVYTATIDNLNPGTYVLKIFGVTNRNPLPTDSNYDMLGEKTIHIP